MKMKRLARGLSSLFTSCLTGTRRHGTHGRLNNETCEEEEVYILPGEHLVCDAGTGNNRNKREYVPPEIPQSSLRTSHVPSAEDFKLLKTLGKGAFGKVCYEGILTYIQGMTQECFSSVPYSPLGVKTDYHYFNHSMASKYGTM